MRSMENLMKKIGGHLINNGPMPYKGLMIYEYWYSPADDDKRYLIVKDGQMVLDGIHTHEDAEIVIDKHVTGVRTLRIS